MDNYPDNIIRYAAACKFLEDNNLLTIIRGHEAQEEGLVPLISK